MFTIVMALHFMWRTRRQALCLIVTGLMSELHRKDSVGNRILLTPATTRRMPLSVSLVLSLVLQVVALASIACQVLLSFRPKAARLFSMTAALLQRSLSLAASQVDLVLFRSMHIRLSRCPRGHRR